MIKCQNCGNINTAESNFCRFCGTKFRFGQPTSPPLPPPLTSQPTNYEYPTPRPYAWKTDEFPTPNDARRTVGGTARMESLGQTSPFGGNQQQHLAIHQQHLSQPYRCPHCGSQYLPRTERRISTGGWITFAVLLVVFFPLFWIGLMIKEDVRICPSCLYQVG